MARKHVLTALAIVMMTSPVFAKDYNFKDLAMKDYYEMDKLVRSALGRGTIDDVEREPKVREALKIVLSRRNTDGKRSFMISNLQGQLPEGYFKLALHRVAQEAIMNFKNDTNPDVERTTSLLVLENLISEMRARPLDFQDTLEVIRDAKLEINSSLASYRRLQAMETNESPSEIAELVLKDALKKDKQEQKIAQSQIPVADVIGSHAKLAPLPDLNY